MPSLSQGIQTINRSTYKLDLSGVVGLFGGNNAVDALETIHLYAGRRWAGWYNYPGSATVAKKFGQMASGRFWDSLFPGPNVSPAMNFNLAGNSGPDYSGFFSGTKLQTKYLGHLIAGWCVDHHPEQLQLLKRNGKPGRETGSSAAVTVLSLHSEQHEKVSRSLSMADVNVTKQKHEIILVKPERNPPIALIATVPSLVSILAFVFCLLGQDPLCAALILLGIVSSGISSIVLGTAILKICVPVPSLHSPPGDGLMFPADGSIIVLKGKEADVNIITKGEFQLDYSKGIPPRKKYHMVGISSFLLLTQFLVQLLLIPLCTFFGQIMFLISFIASGGYHLYVVSHGKEIVHRNLLLQQLPMQVDKRKLGTRTQMAVFVCLIVGDNDHQVPPMSKSDDVLCGVLPNANETAVWRYWKKKVLKELDLFWKWNSEQSSPYVPAIQAAPEDQTDEGEFSNFTEGNKSLLSDLIDDAWCAFNGYPKWRSGGPIEVARERYDSARELGKSPLASER